MSEVFYEVDHEFLRPLVIDEGCLRNQGKYRNQDDMRPPLAVRPVVRVGSIVRPVPVDDGGVRKLAVIGRARLERARRRVRAGVCRRHGSGTSEYSVGQTEEM